MQHLDEGTIHAWIDGALDAEERARVEAHVADCAACGAAVAEARGLVAGASRVLLALDAGSGSGRVDAGRGRGEVGSRRVEAGRSGSVWRRLRLTPVRVAAAAVLMVAAGSVLVVRERDRIAAGADRAMMIAVDTAKVGSASEGTFGGGAGGSAAAARPEVATSAAPSVAAAQAADSNPEAQRKPAVAERRSTTAASGGGAVPVEAQRKARADSNIGGRDADAGRAVAVAPPAPAPAAPVRRMDSTRRTALSEVAVGAVQDSARTALRREAVQQKDVAAPAVAGAISKFRTRALPDTARAAPARTVEPRLLRAEAASAKANAYVVPAAEAAAVAGCYVVTSQPGVAVPARLSLDTTANLVVSLGAAFGGASERRALEPRAARAPAAAPAPRPAPDAMRTIRVLDATGAASRVAGGFWSILPSGSVRIVLPPPAGAVLEVRPAGSALIGVARGPADSATVALHRVECSR